MRKLILLTLCFLPSCGLLHKVPPSVVKGQLAAYEGVQHLEDNYEALLTEVETKQKLLITYIHNFAFEIRMKTFREKYPVVEDPPHWQPESEEDEANRKQENHDNLAQLVAKQAELEAKRDENIARDYAKVDESIQKWRKLGALGHDSVKKLLEAVYNNISENPISVDNIAVIIGKSQELWGKIKEQTQ